jgi:hypothetical protein
VYATLVTDWLGAPAAPSVIGAFPTLPILSSA